MTEAVLLARFGSLVVAETVTLFVIDAFFAITVTTIWIGVPTALAIEPRLQLGAFRGLAEEAVQRGKRRIAFEERHRRILVGSSLRNIVNVVSPVSRVAWNGHSGGVDWHLELDRSVLIPGQLVTGRLSLHTDRAIETRGLVVALSGVEHWRHRQSQSDGAGHTTTRVVTSQEALAHEPVQLRETLDLGAGQTLKIELELPVPPDGPATLQAEDAGLDWTVQAKLDIPGGLDSRIEGDVVVAQPTALLRAGAVRMGEFALFESADVAADGLTGSIELKPMPLVCGAPFAGRVAFAAPDGTRARGVRAELRVHVEATVSQGESQTITLWSGVLGAVGAEGVDDVGGPRAYEIAGMLPQTAVPSIELPHGRASASFHVILDRPWAVDTHLSRDVAIATTAEI